MASNINPFNIDGAYPVAGQDNDSQGFRDNFTSIRNNLAVAKSEIEDLQAKALLKTALTGTSLDNNLAGSTLAAPQLRGYSETLLDHSFLQGALSLDFSSANIHKVTTTGSITLQFTSTWPASGLYGKMILWINIANTAHTLTVPITSPGVTINLEKIAGANTTTGVITFDKIGNYMLAFSTVDAGQNIFIEEVSRNYKLFQDRSFYYNPTVNDTVMIGYGLALNNGLALETGQDQVSTFGSYNALAVGELSIGTINNQTIDTGHLGGYTVTAARGNLILNTLTGVKNNDLLGYVSSVAYTGVNNSGNTLQQTASIGFYSTGSNVSYGLGGNIVFFTAPDGQNNVTSARQVVGIENNLNARIFGNLVLASSTTSTSSPYVPTTYTSSGTVGQIAWSNAGYFYVCYQTDRWMRITASLTW